jgi:Flp pilus assembly protein TadB
MNAAAIPWGALLTESVTMFLLLLGLGLGLIGIWALWSQGSR